MTASERETIILLSDDGVGSVSTNSPRMGALLRKHLGKPLEERMGWHRWPLAPDQFVLPKRGKQVVDTDDGDLGINLDDDYL